MPKRADAATAERLKELADAEMTAAKERLTQRTEAAALFADADARLVAARSTWEATQGEAATDKAAAVEQLVESGMKPVQVAELLGIDAKALRGLRATAATRPTADAGNLAAEHHIDASGSDNQDGSANRAA